MKPAGDDQLDDDLAAQLERLPELRADEGFARDLRARFVAGTFAAAPAAPPRASRVWLGPLLTALAAGILLTVFLVQRRETASPAAGWRLLATPGARGVSIEGQSLDLARSEEFLSVLASGGSLRTSEEGGVRLAFGQRFVLDIGPGSEIVLPVLRDGGDAGPYILRAESGRLVCSTGPAFPGSRLLIFSPDAEVQVVGTRFAVDVYPSGTCVCCAQGRVAVRSLRAEDRTSEVAAGELAFAFRDGEFASDTIRADHLEPLRALEDFWK